MTTRKRSSSFTIRRISTRNPRLVRGIFRLRRGMRRGAVLGVLTAILFASALTLAQPDYAAAKTFEETSLEKDGVIGVGAGIVNSATEILFGKSVKEPCQKGLTDIPFNIDLGGGTTISTGGKLGDCAIFGGSGTQAGVDALRDQFRGPRFGSATGVIVGWTNFALPFVSMLAITALTYAGYLYITGIGNSERAESAKKIILWVTVGIIVILAAFSLVNTVISGSALT